MKYLLFKILLLAVLSTGNCSANDRVGHFVSTIEADTKDDGAYAVNKTSVELNNSTFKGMTSIYSAIALFALGAGLGLYLLSLVLTNKPTPRTVAVIHGLFAAAGIVLLIIYSVNHQWGPKASLIIFFTAALGGIVMFYRDVTGKPIPKWLGIAHGLVALTGFIFLLFFAFGG